MQEIYNIYSEYPWASELTATRMAKATSNAPQTRARIAGLFASSASKQAFDSLLTSFQRGEAAQRQEQKSQDRLNNALDDTTKAIMASNVDGLGAMASLIEKTTEAASELALGDRLENGMGAMQRSNNRFLKGLGFLGEGAVKIAGSTAGVAAGLGTFAAAFVNSQDKLIKTMIDVGLADGNMTNMTMLRQRAATLGMGFDEFGKLLQVSSNLTATSSENAMQGALKFGDMAKSIASNKEINKFGMRTNDLAFALATTADALYKSNQISSLDANAQKKIIEAFTTTNEIALGLATTTGENRSKLLNELDQQRQDQILNTNFTAAREEYIQQFGEENFDNFTEGMRMYLANMANTFGRDSALYLEIEKTLKAASFDIGVDQNIVNNITPELVQLMNEIGGGLLNEFIDQGNSILAGQTDEQGAIISSSRILGIVTEAANNRRREVSVDPITMAANQTMNIAIVANEKLKDITFEELATASTDATAAANVADNAINIIDDLAITFRQTLEAITPGIDTLDATLDTTYFVGDLAIQVMNFARMGFGFDPSTETMRDIQAKMGRAEVRDVVVYQPGTSEYENLPASMRITPDGPITARSIAMHQAVTGTMLTNEQIQQSSRSELQTRVDDLREKVAEARQQLDSGVNVESGMPEFLSDSEISALKQAERILNEQITKITAQIAEVSQGDNGGVLNGG